MVHDGRSASAVTKITLYARPGCPFCTALRWRLRRSGIPVSEIDIWADPAGAAAVRAATGGDETVPTVAVGPTTLVNPGMDQVVAAVAEHAPHLLTGAPRPARRSQWRRR